MGVGLADLVPKKRVSLKELSGKIIAIDAYNTLYQFLAIIRGFSGEPLKDRSGRVTSHLSGLLFRTVNLLEKGIKPIYVFDGTPPDLKKAEIKRRIKVKREALVKYKKALREKRLDEARKYAQATAQLKDYMIEDSKRLLNLMGVPWIQAPSEGEAQAAYLVKRKDAAFCASQDYDSLIFGAPMLVRNVTLAGKRRLPSKKVYIEVQPEIVELKRVLKELEITFEQLVDLAIMIGTDFNPKEFKGIGPKGALKLVKKHGSIEKILPVLKNVEFTVDLNEIREIFLHPKVRHDYEIMWENPDADGIVKFLSDERDFSEKRVVKALEKALKGMKRMKSERTLDAWLRT